MFLDEPLCDQLVCGLQHAETQKKLLAKSELTLQKALGIVMAAEMTVLEGQQIHIPINEEIDINAVRYTKQCHCCEKRGHSMPSSAEYMLQVWKERPSTSSMQIIRQQLQTKQSNR